MSIPDPIQTLAAHLPLFLHLPAEPFLMGTPENDLSALAKHYGGTRESYREESPQHMLTLPASGVAQVPVTHRLYAAYIAATGAPPPLLWHDPHPPADLLDHPVVDVSWNDATAFCSWLTATCRQHTIALHLAEPGQRDSPRRLDPATVTVRLPSEAEWEHAARGSDGRMFPWGHAFDNSNANTRENGLSHTTPVGSYPTGASPYGLLDMAGNVWELTATLDALYPYQPGGGREAGADNVGRRIARGGCYMNPQGYARCATRFRFAPTVANAFLGFRLALTF